ncbi:MAG: hypothetical protein A4E65_02694 [Syntrophorhabdus sp. PtaU1.Bin153]|nr:MAG: hypothetical protein A4E65_02694 [Syntrophorhabdus sp. PtaU1.Bin153]
MDMIVQERFIKLWAQYFGKTELPIVFSYADNPGGVERVRPPKVEHKCVIAELAKARRGTPIALDVTAIGCFGGKRYLGFTEEFRPNIDFFLSYGIPGEMEGERYKKTPEIVREVMRIAPRFAAPGRFIVFKRWDKIEKSDNPDVVIFFARPDVLSGLFTLANYDQVDPNAVFSPFAAGCATIVTYPYIEKDAEYPRAVLGMFDVSARPCVQEDCLTFAVPMNRFAKMIQNMEESFLTTGSWKKIKKRIVAAVKRTTLDEKV